MANIVMTGNNNKSGKSAKGSKDGDMNSFYGKPVDVAPTPAAAIDIPATQATTAPPSIIPAPGSPQTIRTPSEDTDGKWKRVAKKSDAKAQKASAAAVETPAETATATATATPAATAPATATPAATATATATATPAESAVETPTTPPAIAAERVQRAASIREGPPPVCRLNNEAVQASSDSSSEKKLFDSMREMIATQQRAIETMQQQLNAQAYPQFHAFPQYPFGYHMPMMMRPPHEVFGVAAPAIPNGPVLRLEDGTPVAALAAVLAAHTPRDAAPAPRDAAPRDAAPAAAAQHKQQKQHIREPQQAQQAKPQASKDPKADDDEEVEFSPFELRLNDDCPGGFNCPNSKKPSKCPKNHHKLGNVIKKGAKLPKFFCKWERPWKKGPNSKPLRCRNAECFFAHLDGRKDFIEKAAMNEASHASAE